MLVLRPGMPIILADDTPCASNIAVLHNSNHQLISARYLWIEAEPRHLVASYIEATPLAEFGVGLLCSTKLKMFACCPLSGIPPRALDANGKHRRWHPKPDWEILKYRGDVFTCIPSEWLEKEGAITMRALQRYTTQPAH